MEKVFYLLAATETGEKATSSIFGVLGIDWKILIFQVIAFGLLIFVLAKWVYPPILAMFDRRQKLIDDSVKAAKETIAQSEKAAAEIAEQLKDARKEANDIVAVSRKQSEQILLTAEAEAQERTERRIASARQQLARDTETARKALRDETAELVALATEKVVGAKIDPHHDAKLIDEALSQAEKERTETAMASARQQMQSPHDDSPEHIAKVLDTLSDYLVSDKQTREAGLLVRDIEAAILREHNHLIANVTSARKLTAEARADIIQMLKQETNVKTVELIETIDESLVGGVVVRTPDDELNASLKSRLARLKTI